MAINQGIDSTTSRNSSTGTDTSMRISDHFVFKDFYRKQKPDPHRGKTGCGTMRQTAECVRPTILRRGISRSSVRCQALRKAFSA